MSSSTPPNKSEATPLFLREAVDRAYESMEASTRKSNIRINLANFQAVFSFFTLHMIPSSEAPELPESKDLGKD